MRRYIIAAAIAVPVLMILTIVGVYAYDEKAIEYLESSLNAGYWESDQGVNNNDVFDAEKKAVSQLVATLGRGLLDEADVVAAIDTLVNADRILARVAIISAADRGFSQRDIDNAEKEMAKAAARWADGAYGAAIVRYQKAWERVSLSDRYGPF